MKALLGILGLTVTAGLLVSSPTSAGAQQADPAPQLPPDYWVEDEITLPEQSSSEVQPVSNEGAPAAECTWERPIADLTLPGQDLGPPPTPNSFLVGRNCGGVFTGEFQWFTPGEPGPSPLPSPEALAETIRARLEGTLPAPALASDPGVGEAAIVAVPTFVAVSNWTGVVTDEECDPGGVLCVSVTATPRLSFSPGEPGAAATACAGPGSRFVEGAGSSLAQAAAPGACAYVYRLRTGVGDRPEAWPGLVTTTWELVWASTSGASGSLPPVVKSTSLPRPVHEVQTMIER